MKDREKLMATYRVVVSSADRTDLLHSTADFWVPINVRNVVQGRRCTVTVEGTSAVQVHDWEADVQLASDSLMQVGSYNSRHRGENNVLCRLAYTGDSVDDGQGGQVHWYAASSAQPSVEINSPSILQGYSLHVQVLNGSTGHLASVAAADWSVTLRFDVYE